LESSRPKPGRMEETLEGGRGPPGAVAPLERDREREREREKKDFYKSPQKNSSGERSELRGGRDIGPPVSTYRLGDPIFRTFHTSGLEWVWSTVLLKQNCASFLLHACQRPNCGSGTV
jgi:hypothetical protein